MTEPNPLLRIDKLTLRNFRCFESCALSLNKKLTVLVAENGQGKTAILDAIGIALQLFVDTLSDNRQYHPGFLRSDVRLVSSAEGVMSPALPINFEAEGIINGNPLKWMRELKGNGLRSRTSKKKSEPLCLAAKELRQNILGTREAPDAQAGFLPFVAFYGTGRLWSEHRLTSGKKAYFADPRDRMSGYIDSLSPSSSFKGMLTWFENKMAEIGNPQYKSDYSRNISLITAVQAAIRTALAPVEWCNLLWDPGRHCLMVEHPTHGSLPLSALSDGIQNMIALVADIARRCASLNPHLGEQAAQQTPGILLVDEVDMHLHPRWQQVVVELLQKAFPAMQIVLTTHSPHVLSSVDWDSIRIIRFEGDCAFTEKPGEQTRGDESASILAKVMNVDPVPKVESAQLLTNYRTLVQGGLDASQEAQRMWQQLVGHFGVDHHLLQEAAVLRRLQEFKRQNNIGHA